MANPKQVTIGVSSHDIDLLKELRNDFSGDASFIGITGPQAQEDASAGPPHIVVGIAPGAAYARKKGIDAVYEIVKRRLMQDPDCKHRKAMIYTADKTVLSISECTTGKRCSKAGKVTARS